MISARRATWLVARREIVTRGRDKSVIIGTVVTIVIIAFAVLIPSIGGGTSTATVAVTGSPAVLDAAARLDKTFSLKLKVRRVADDAAVRRLVEAGTVDAGLVETNGRIVTGADPPDGLEALLQTASQVDRLGRALPQALPVQNLDQDSADKQGFALVALIVLYGQMLTYGLLVANGVVEEKSSRIVEILLATLRPRQLLAGKVLGVGVVGLIQLLFVGAVGLLIASASGKIDVQVGALPIVLAWFLGGYALYACAFALIGASVQRQEDLQSAATPLIFAILISFFLSFQAADDPGSSLSLVLSFVPPSAPLVMPVRMIAGDVPVLEIVLSVALLLAAAVAVVSVAARLYGRAVLQTGGRVKLRALLRA